MIEIKMVVEVPGVPEALNNLARAISENKGAGAFVDAVKKETAKLIPSSEDTVQQPVQAASVTATAVPMTPPNSPVQEVQNPVTAVTAPVVANTPAPAPAPVPTPTAAPVPAPVTAPPVPVQEKPVTMNDLAIAGARLVDAGKMDSVVALLREFGAEAIPQLKAEQYGSFAQRLRELGAAI